MDLPPALAGQLPGPIGTTPCGGGIVGSHPGLPGVTVEFCLFTPMMALAALAVNVRNRPQKTRLKLAMERDLKNDRWLFNGATIVFSNLGYMDDGQHRCEAIVVTGIAGWVTIVRGTEPAAQKTMDSGAVRQAADQLAMDGVGNAKLVSTIARMVYQRLETAEEGPSGSSMTAMSPTEILVTVARHPELHEAAGFAAAGYQASRYLQAGTGALGMAWWLVTGCEHRTEGRDCQEEAEGRRCDRRFTGQWFMDRLVDGLDIGTNGPQIVTLRDRFMAQGKTAYAEKLGLMDQLFFIVRAWNAFQAKEPIGKLQRPRGGARYIPEVAYNGIASAPTGKEAREIPVPGFAAAAG
jgi:hypothetical protein